MLVVGGISMHASRKSALAELGLVSDADEFREQAEDARQMAAQALSQEDKAFWLELAEGWLKLAQEADFGPTSAIMADRIRRWYPKG